jgi:hypothetical protein
MPNFSCLHPSPNPFFLIHTEPIGPPHNIAIEHHTLSVNNPTQEIPHIANSFQTPNYPKFQPSPRLKPILTMVIYKFTHPKIPPKKPLFPYLSLLQTNCHLSLSLFIFFSYYSHGTVSVEKFKTKNKP